VTIYLGWVFAFRRSRLQPEVVALWSSLLPQILHGVQIDTSHCRHLFLMCAASMGWRPRSGSNARAVEIADGRRA
jgi:hypothetical protein